MILTDHSAVRSDETRLLSGRLQNRLGLLLILHQLGQAVVVANTRGGR